MGGFSLEWVFTLLSGICCSCVGPLRERLVFRDDVVAIGNLHWCHFGVDSIIVGSYGGDGDCYLVGLVVHCVTLMGC